MNTILSAAFLALLATPAPAQQEAGDLVLGMSTALKGPAKDLGIEMRSGVLAAFEECNRKGGIRDRHLRLISLNDGYEPKVTIPNIKALIEEHQALAIIGNVGTPTAVAALPLIEEHQVPFLFPYTGAGNLRTSPPSDWVVNYRASYAQETAAMVDSLITYGGLKPEEIAFFTQRDSYGDAGYYGGLAALKRHGLKDEEDITHGRYERNTLSVEKGVSKLLMAEVLPKAVIMVATYAPCAKAIRMAREYGIESLFLNVSFVGATSLAKDLGEEADDVIVTQVVPHVDADLPIVAACRKALTWDEQHLPEEERTEVSFPALEGYIAGRILVQAIHGMEGPVSRKSLRDALLELDAFDLGLGVELKLDQEQRQASQTVWPTIIEGGRVKPFDWADLSDRFGEEDGRID